LHSEDRSQLSVLVTFAVALLLEGVMSVVWSTRTAASNLVRDSSWTVLG